MRASQDDTGERFDAYRPEDHYGASVGDAPSQEEVGLRQKLAHLPKHALLWFIRFYQKGISPLFPRTCRFVPSCSQYAAVAVSRYGFLKGGWLALKRLAKCGPWHPGGYDPVP